MRYKRGASLEAPRRSFTKVARSDLVAVAIVSAAETSAATATGARLLRFCFIDGQGPPIQLRSV